MVIILTLYISLIWLLFFKFKWLPWNKLTQWLCLIVGVVILSGFMVGLQTLAPSSSEAVITGRIVEIAPQVSGRITRINIEPMQDLNEGDILFEIDPTAYQASVDSLKARLKLATLRLEQYKELVAEGAGSGFQLEQSTAEVVQLEAQLSSARFDLDNTKVRAPGPGMVPVLILRDGMQVSSSRSVLVFMDKREMWIGARFQQKALQTVKIGDTAMVNFPAVPGQVFETEVLGIPNAIREGQLDASGMLPSVQEQRATRSWPILVKLPEELPENVLRAGVSAEVYIHTEGAGVVGIVAVILQWISTSLDAIT
ncbi:MAG: HlyD family secretion protein [Gammaproteobacteria bacterium]|nr:HlyD family secretion protein [Gammaproteobacteria bacterium]